MVSENATRVYLNDVTERKRSEKARKESEERFRSLVQHSSDVAMILVLLEQSLESLSELQQKVVYLFFYKDLSQTDIGHRLGLPQRKVSRIIASTTKSLKDKLLDHR